MPLRAVKPQHETRTRILDAAEELFMQHGFEGTSMRLLTAKAGVNLAAIWLDLLIGRQPEVPTSYRVGVHYQHEEGDLRALGRMLRHGPRGDALRALVPHPDTALAVFSATDPWPLLTSFSRFLRRGSRTAKEGRKPLGRGKPLARSKAA